MQPSWKTNTKKREGKSWVYGGYTVGIRWVYGGMGWVYGVYGGYTVGIRGIRWVYGGYTGYTVGIRWVYGGVWCGYTVGIRWVYGGYTVITDISTVITGITYIQRLSPSHITFYGSKPKYNPL